MGNDAASLHDERSSTVRTFQATVPGTSHSGNTAFLMRPEGRVVRSCQPKFEAAGSRQPRTPGQKTACRTALNSAATAQDAVQKTWAQPCGNRRARAARGLRPVLSALLQRCPLGPIMAARRNFPQGRMAPVASAVRRISGAPDSIGLIRPSKMALARQRPTVCNSNGIARTGQRDKLRENLKAPAG